MIIYGISFDINTCIVHFLRLCLKYALFFTYPIFDSPKSIERHATHMNNSNPLFDTLTPVAIDDFKIMAFVVVNINY